MGKIMTIIGDNIHSFLVRNILNMYVESTRDLRVRMDTMVFDLVWGWPDDRWGKK